MKIALAQMNTRQGEFTRNLDSCADFAMRARAGGADLVVFPEMFVSGFNYKKNIEFLAKNPQAVLRRLSQIALENSIGLAGSIPHLEAEEKLLRNRFVFFDSTGKLLSHYDKIHLFSVFNENKYVKAGDEIVVADTPFGRIGFAVCYDIRFPDIFVRMKKKGAKLFIICAAFPHPRSEHWRILSKARAIENQCFVIAVNRGGEEIFPAGDVKYFGLSAAIDPWGGIVAECPLDSESLVFADINLSEVDDICSKIPSWADRRDDIY